MKQGSNKRSRGRGNRKPSRTQVYDSSGPEGRIRGNANQVYDKYLALGRDAYSSGDRIAAENFFQHAEHYYRIVVAIEAARAQQEQQQQPRGDGQQGDRNQQNNNNRRFGNEGGDDRQDFESVTPHDPRDPVPAFDDDDDVSSEGDNSAAEVVSKPDPQPEPKPRQDRRPRRKPVEAAAPETVAEPVSDAHSLPQGLLKPVTTSTAATESDDEIRHSSGTAKPRGRRPRRPKEEKEIDQSVAD